MEIEKTTDGIFDFLRKLKNDSHEIDFLIHEILLTRRHGQKRSKIFKEYRSRDDGNGAKDRDRIRRDANI